MTTRFNAVALILLAAASTSIGLAQSGPPETVDMTFLYNAGDPTACSFPVQVHVAGKGKAINLPGNRTIITAPGQNVVVTNLDTPTKQVTLNATGVLTVYNQPDGGVVVIGTGRNVATDPAFGLTLVIGKFSFAFSGAGTLIQGLTPQGGQTISVCSLIS
jgi:hypothetical protein